MAQHTVTVTLKSSGAWVVECVDCGFKLPAMNQTDANRLKVLHLRVVRELEKEKNESESDH